MMTPHRWAGSLACSLLLFSRALGDPSPREDAVARLEECVRQLDDDRYAVREKAQKELIAAGEPALALLRNAMAQGSEEARLRATQAYHAIRWNALRIPQDCPKAVLDTLSALEGKDWPGPDQRREPLTRAFQGNIQDFPEEAARLPEDEPLWQFLDRAPFEKDGIYQAASQDGAFRYWRARSDRAILQAGLPREGHTPRFYLFRLKGRKLDLGSPAIQWNAGKRDIPILREALPYGGRPKGDGGPFFSSLRRIEEKGKVLGLLYEFEWDQDKPYAGLRYLVLTEDLVICCVSHL